MISLYKELNEFIGCISQYELSENPSLAGRIKNLKKLLKNLNTTSNQVPSEKIDVTKFLHQNLLN